MGYASISITKRRKMSLFSLKCGFHCTLLDKLLMLDSTKMFCVAIFEKAIRKKQRSTY